MSDSFGANLKIATKCNIFALNWVIIIPSSSGSISEVGSGLAQDDL